MKVYIYGYAGNMAQRYRSILRYLGHDVAGHDVQSKLGSFEAKEADRIIIATPTSRHCEDIKSALAAQKPILCEKPITKDRLSLIELLGVVEESKVKLEMVSQYDYLPFSRYRDGLTYYNYFKHGGDGIVWDCINILYHANGEIKLAEDSPHWQCVINGDHLRIQDMDQAYVSMLSNFLHCPRNDVDRIFEAHELCRHYEVEQCKQS